MKKIRPLLKILLLMVYLLSVNINVSLAQETINKAEVIYISSGTDLFIEGNIENQNVGNDSATIINDGNLILTGNWYSPFKSQYMGNGKFMLSGNRSQEFSGMEFNELIINGSGLKILTSDATIFNNVTLQNGIINTALTSSTIVLGPLATLTETSDNYIIGYVKTTRQLSKNVQYDFGGMGFELHATLNDPGRTILFRATGDSIIQSVAGSPSIKRYFDLIPENNGNLGAKITFRYGSNEINGLNESELEFFSSIDYGKSWNNKSFNTRDIHNRTLEVPADISLSRWTLGNYKSILTKHHELNVKEDFYNIYPNPTKKFIIIENNFQEDFTLKMTNVNGQIIRQARFNSQIILDVEEFSAGVYFLEMISESGRVFKEKIVILNH